MITPKKNIKILDLNIGLGGHYSQIKNKIHNLEYYAIDQDSIIIQRAKIEFQNDIVYDTSYSDGQIKKTTNDNELKKYMGDFQFTTLENGTEISIML